MLTFPFKSWPEVEASQAMERIQEETNEKLNNEILEILRNIKETILQLCAERNYISLQLVDSKLFPCPQEWAKENFLSSFEKERCEILLKVA